jgi:hypothetical protein
MSVHSDTDMSAPPPLDLSRWRSAPLILIVLGGLGALIGAFVSPTQFGYSWLLAFMFFLSLCLGALFLVLMHHLFDASWSVPIRRFLEQMACLLPAMAVLFVPIALLAPKIYPWMTTDPHGDHALHSKHPLFTWAGFYITTVICFVIWWFLSTRLRAWSLEQDRTGSARCTYRMRFHASWGIFAFAVTLTMGAIMWMKALHHQWFSTMYGVYYFAGSVWMTVATVYFITAILKRQGPLRSVVNDTQFYFIGSILFAFTVFYAYIHFSQYFIIWNANIPEETFWYVVREKGSWWDIGLVIIFGHFFIPFLLLLRIDVKLSWIMLPLAGWAWIMHFLDMSYSIMPVIRPEGFILHPLDLACMAFIGGVLSMLFLKYYAAHPPFPQRDPRMAEALGLYMPPGTDLPPIQAPGTPHVSPKRTK